MDYLWTPWRYSYVAGGDAPQRAGVPAELAAWDGETNCVFCNMRAAADHAIATGMDADAADRAAGIVHRGRLNFVCLNAFPYNSGHVMVIPYEHLDSLAKLEAGAAAEMMLLAQQMETALHGVYRPEGINLGMNMGKAAGAGVAGHIHLHLLPRWLGDTNFMTVTGETRVLPEGLQQTWKRLREQIRKNLQPAAEI